MIPRCRKTRWLERVGHGPACAHGDTACFRILTESGIILWRHRLLNTIASKFLNESCACNLRSETWRRWLSACLRTHLPRTHRPAPQARRPRPHRPLSHRRPGLGRQLGSLCTVSGQHSPRALQHRQREIQVHAAAHATPPPIINGNTARAALATDTCGPRGTGSAASETKS